MRCSVESLLEERRVLQTRLDEIDAALTPGDGTMAPNQPEDHRTILDTIITHIPCAVFWKDKNGVYLGCNAKSAQDLGMPSPADVVGQTDYDMPFTKEEADFYVECDRRVMASGEPLLNIEETQRRADGHEATLLTSKVPLCDRDGMVMGILGIYTDISELKHMEEQLR